MKRASTTSVVALCGSIVLCGGALAAQSDDESGSSPPPSVDDEIIVLGRSWREIRAELQRAEEAFYARFNEINSDDEFDIHCYRETRQGSRIMHRVCEANFWRDALAEMGAEAVRIAQGTPTTPLAVIQTKAQMKNKLLVAEMRQLATQDEELQQDFLRMVNLDVGLRDLKKSGRRGSQTSSTAQTADQGTLPYDAAFAADVHIGRKPWTHTLTQRTFTFAHVYGEIADITVECRGQTESLRYQEGAEWTLPEDWRACDLRVDAPRGTTFTLYEFK